MVTAAKRWTATAWTVCGLILAGLLAGCGKEEPADIVLPPKLAVQNNPPPATGTPDGVVAKLPPEVRLRQSFKDATVEEPPEDQRLPDVTKTGKSVGRLYEAVVNEWDKIPFLTPDGKQLTYTATVTTDLGVITIELWPQVAPNHVRSFVALARARYYDGLAFDRTVKREQPDSGLFEYLEGGCPIGTGEPNYGSIGYWLKPEFNPTVTHDVGTIGAWHGEEVESAACKFYINMSKAEWMDNNFTLFGKVTQGLGVLRAIHARPVQEDVIADRPFEPVVIQNVTITSAVKQ